MSEVRLGKLLLRWCKTCNLPILEIRKCRLCNNLTVQVKLTPPGDVRPIFSSDINLIRRVIDEQFGLRCGEILLPNDKIILLNKSPAIDRMDEVIVDGEVVGALRYDLKKRYRFVLRLSGTARIKPNPTKSWVVVDDGAVQPILSGANAMVAGILKASDGIKLGDEIVISDEKEILLAVGIAKLSSEQMKTFSRGVGVKIRYAGISGNEQILKGRQNWQDVIEANKEVLEKRISTAKKFIQRTVERFNQPVAVSFSGGKDSLATLFLVLESGIKPKILFVDTGLEFNETVCYVETLAKKLNLELILERASDSFWSNIKYFGPPGKDFRWCCKTCKLGPTVKLIQKNFPEGVLSFIGQRAYESEQRASKPNIWRNPWVPGQIGASPIQSWTALHIWLYLFSKGIAYNPWYERGLERIGCWLCPASNMADFELVEKHYPDYTKWKQYLQSYALKHGYPSEWIEYGLWRWKKLPSSVINLLKENGLKIESKAISTEKLSFYSTVGYQPCVEGVSSEGVFSKKLDLEKVGNLLNILGDAEYDSESDSYTVNGIRVFREGSIIVKGSNESEINKKMKNVKDLVLKAEECIACGICIGRCNRSALQLKDKVFVDVSKCIHCGECLGLCPVTQFNDEHEFKF